MLGKIKNILLFLKKKTLLAVFFFISFGVFLPLRAIGASIEGMGTAVALYLMRFITYILLDGSIWLAKAAGTLLNWVISPSFVSFSYTNPGGPNANPIIETGLGITQGFTNIFLVLILIYIAISTILKLEEYKAQKLLPIFILVALLVNFAPVLCGVIVDASNILMDFFVGGLEGDSFGKIIEPQVETLKGLINQSPNIITAAPYISQMFFLVPFLFILTLVLLLFTFLFIARYLAIWMLVILSPLAFVSLILPVTKKYWANWWNQLIQWSFMGAIGGFFLYLGLALVMMTQKKTFGTGVPKIANQGGFIEGVLPYTVSLAFLIIGFITSLKCSAAGASIAINAAKRSGRAVRGVGVGVGKRVGRGTGSYLADARISAKLKTKEEREASGKSKYSPARYLSRITPRQESEQLSKDWDKAPVLRWFRPESLDKFGQHKESMEKLGETAGPSDQIMDRISNGKFVGAKAAKALFDVVKNRGDSQDVIAYYGKKFKHLNKDGSINEETLFNDSRFINNNVLTRSLDYLKNAGKKGTLLRMDPRLAKIGQPIGNKKEMIEKLMEAKTSDVSGWEREVIDNEEIMEASMAIKGDDFFRTVGRLKGDVLSRKHTMNSIYSKWVEKNKLDTKKDHKDKFFKYLSEEYNVDPVGIKLAFENPRFQKLGYGDNFNYINEEQRKTKPGTISDNINSNGVKKEIEGIRRLKKPLSPWQSLQENKEKERMVEKTKKRRTKPRAPFEKK